MAVTITFIRHAETTANAEHRWQGFSDAPLSTLGESQLERLADRYRSMPPRLIVASDLDRTMATARAIGSPTADPRWREFSVGSWEGLTTDEVATRYPDDYAALVRGEDVSLGGGERMSEFRSRIAAAFEDLVDGLDEDADPVVVTHGGAIWAVLDHVLGTNGSRAPVTLAGNTSVTRIRVSDEGRRSVAVFNDTTHLDGVPTRPGFVNRSVTLVRHGETEGNVAGRWQGRSDSSLTDRGRWQVNEAASVAPEFDAIYASPLGRAMDSAAILAAKRSLDPTPVEGLVEMSFGSWENLTPEEAATEDPDRFDAIYGRGEDRPRGGDGESFSGAGERMGRTIAGLARAGEDDETPVDVAAVSHGAAIRAYATQVVGLGFAERNRLPVPRNSSMSRVTYFEGAPVLASYNVAPHLD